MTNVDPYRPPAASLDPAPQPVAKCPECGAQSATQVKFTWWGGALGPALFHVVKCQGCRTQYNGKTGGKLTKIIIAYQGVVLLVLLVVLALVWK